MLARWGRIGLVLWVVATATAFLLHSQGVRREPVCLTLADGTSIHGVLYRTDSAELYSPAPAAVVLHGMAVTHQSCEPALAMPLARFGFVVLAIDLRGHGRSGGSLPEIWFRDLDRILEMRTDQPEVTAAIQYLKSLPEVDAKRVGLLGHSLGGLIAANAACADADVVSVVTISAAPQLCDANRPRNLLMLAGDLDRLIPPERFIPALLNATGGKLSEPDTPIGKLKRGTGRELKIARHVSHMSSVFDPTASRRAVQWTCLSVGHEPGPVPGSRLAAIGCAVLLAVLAGGVACTVFLKSVTERILPGGIVAGGAWGRASVALTLCLAAAPAAAFLGDQLPTVGVLYAASSVALFVLLALVWMAAGYYGGQRMEGRGRDSSAPFMGTAVGILCVLLGGVWLGLPFGATWVDLTTCTRRIVVALLLLPLFVPWSLMLARGIQRTVPASARGFGLARGLAWLAIPVAVWIGNELFNARHPFFGIPVTLLAAAFVLPLPLWFLEDRKGMTTARGVCLAASAAWIFACHLPFVSGG